MTVPGLANRVLLPRGFRFSAAAAGLKASGRNDLALVEAVAGTTAAAVFTKNRVAAAPIEVGRASLRKSKGRVRALIINSGNANCATGKAGVEACQEVCRQTARLLGIRPEQVFPSSTGIIGVPLQTGKIVAQLGSVVEAREATERGLDQVAEAILTTDTRQKQASASFRSGRSQVRLRGIAKGSGMIHPQLATMLAYVFTDAGASPAELTKQLKAACSRSFNCMSVDGDTSTNDTVFLLASGQSGVHLKAASVRSKFASALHEVCQALANQIIADGEGVQHVIHLLIEQAKNREEALTVARAIAHSLLVKTAWAGADPNWGRILAAVGSCGAPVNPSRINIFIGKQQVCRGGTAWPFDEAKAHRDLSEHDCDIRVQLGRGQSKIIFQTTDLTAEYVRINADYST
ncbi:MAG TPA: bifunctional glutamate N-acetyltransferase/amino-acid acetyltransferase ArgJ [Terriglobales bacterium]|nr:bifunctional glutamate N-acetyltransferase/amino-acid acetyltransferase ArgJ [Terriglobales bacterium]